MIMTPTLYASLWTDDYLDLLNYAKEIGDLAWQEEIILKLASTTEETIQSLILDEEKNVLWSKFDAINDELLELYATIEHSKNDAEKLRLSQKVWDLKLQRVHIHNKIKSIDTQK
ncbi:hypothetical protein [Paenibacillus sp. IHBB 10380]|uniref:hypothetical protein n=1 Tax=Paenibacillus sp. IHBB 10380 TaxID=1566358 RepID=UPI0005CF9DFB|nr:hypothetical protein [Paenibacillus sp. IHBB 10380]AJS59727.1 hypothetical protein UB51_15970 [Paenibacillus sp. IHBB 10380]